MKPFKEFSLEDLNQYILGHKLLRTDLRSTDDKQVIDYERLGEILGCSKRSARCLIEGRHGIHKWHYNLLALHAGAITPEFAG